MALAVMAWRWTAREGIYRFSARHLSGTLLGLLAFALAVVAFINLGDLAQNQKRTVPRDVTLLAPVQQAGSALTVEVANLADKPSVLSFARYAWPALLALAVWVFGWITDRQGPRTAGSGSRLDPARLGGPALSERRHDLPRRLAAFLVLHVVIPALRRLWQLPRRTTAHSAASRPERRRTRSDRAAGWRPAVARLVRHSPCGTPARSAEHPNLRYPPKTRRWPSR